MYVFLFSWTAIESWGLSSGAQRHYVTRYLGQGPLPEEIALGQPVRSWQRWGLSQEGFNQEPRVTMKSPLERD